MNDRNDQTALILCQRQAPPCPAASGYPGDGLVVCRSLFVGGWVIPHWFVPAIVIPAGLVAFMVAIVVWATFLERDEGKQFFRVASLSFQARTRCR